MDKPSRLGRGLASLLGEPEPVALATALQARLATSALEPGPFQPREISDPESLRELADSIRARGILQPILARPHPSQQGRYQIIAGERRWRAAQLAELAEVPVVVQTLTDSEAMAAALIENLQRRDLNPIEEAEGYRRLSEEFHLTQDALSRAIGKSRSHVANLLRLLNLPPSVQHELKRGTLTAGHARALLSHPNPAQAALRVISQGLNVRQTEALAAKKSLPEAPPAEKRQLPRQGRESDPDLASVENTLTERLGLAVHIADSKGRGRLTIDYTTLDQLDWLISLLNRE